MTEGADAAFRRFVAAERDALLLQALRLTGDPARAEDAVQAGLASVRARWGRLGADPDAAADAAADAVADAAGRRGLLGGGGQVVEVLEDTPSPPPVPPARWRLDTDAAVDDALARSRRRRRLRLGAVAVGLAAAALVAPRVVPEVVPPSAAGTMSPAGRETGPPEERAGGVTPADDVPVLTEPTRGSLAGDAAFVEAVRRVDWGALTSPPPEERSVVLATDTPDGRVALVAGTVDEDVRGVWLTGPVGAAPEDLTPHVPQVLGPYRPASLLLGGPGPATLVVVTARGDAVEVSPRLQVGPRGTVSRTYEPVPADDGLAVTTVPVTSRGAGTSVRVVRDGQAVHRGAASAPNPAGRAAEVPSLQPLRPVGALPPPRLVAEALTEVAVPLGAEPAALEPGLLWSGTLPLADVPGAVAVVVARSPGGGLVVTTRAGQLGPGGGGRTVPCGVHTPPGTTDVSGLVVARVCDLSSPETEPSEEGRWLVVTAPAGAVAADVLDRRGSVLATVALDGGGGTVLLPDGARDVRTIDAGGRTLTEVPISAVPTAPFGDYGPGT